MYRDPLLASVAVSCVSDVCAIPAADCRSGAIFVVGSGGELPPHGGNQHLFAMDRRSLQHARCSSGALTDRGRVHEVRRPMLKLGALIRIGISPFCRWDSRGALLARSFARFRHFAFVSRTGFSLSWAAFRGCLAPVAGRGNAVCWLLRWLLKSGGL